MEPFYAPSTSAQDLERAARRLEDERVPFAFPLQSAMPQAEVVTGGLPHGLHLAGEVRRVVEEMGLRKVTPHNFLVLRPEAHAATDSYGVFRERERVVAWARDLRILESAG